MKILSEVTSKAGVKGLREDNVLFMISVRLKDLCNEHGIFIMTATQLNAAYQDSDTPDQNLLRGAKSIADKIDLGMIILKVTEKDKEALRLVKPKHLDMEMPELKISVYKNRRGQYKDLLLWCKAKQSTCRITPMFATDYQYNPIQIQDQNIGIDSVF